MKKLIVLAFLCVPILCAGASNQSHSSAQEGSVPGAVAPVSIASWTPLAELTPPQNTDLEAFGLSVSVSGNVAVVGSGPGLHSESAAYVFVKSSSARSTVGPTAKLTASDGQRGDLFGYSVSINGNTIVIGAPGLSGTPGKAYIFVEPAAGWSDMTETAQLTASDGQADDQFGLSSSISGSSVVVGARNHAVGSNTGQGAAYVFVKPTTGWANMTQTAELTASDGAVNGNLGFSAAINGDTAVIGAYFIVGASYVFAKPASGWADMTETAKLTDPKDTGVGYSVAISGNTIVSGSITGGPRGAGAAHVYVKQGSTWKTTSNNVTLRPSDPIPLDHFGLSVATTADTVTVGAPFAPCGGSNCRFPGPGIVYAFGRPAGGWRNMTETQKLTPSDGVSGGFFGESVAASGSAVVVGSTGTNTAYVYKYSPSSFTALAYPEAQEQR
jgi:hypothetical protein